MVISKDPRYLLTTEARARAWATDTSRNSVRSPPVKKGFRRHLY